MPLQPKRVKHRKVHRGRLKGVASRGTTVAFGDYGLQSLEVGLVTARQIEASRVAATHFLAHEGRVYIRIFPQKSFTSRPAESRMGKGKGEPEFWAAEIRPGRMLFEIGGGVPEDMAKAALVVDQSKRKRFLPGHGRQ